MNYIGNLANSPLHIHFDKMPLSSKKQLYDKSGQSLARKYLATSAPEIWLSYGNEVSSAI